MKKLLGIVVLGFFWSNVGVANDLPRLFGITISDKLYNYKTADKPLIEDIFSVQIFPSIQNNDFDFYKVKFDHRTRIYQITGIHKKTTKWIQPSDPSNITEVDLMIYTAQNKKCVETAIEHLKIFSENSKFKKYYKNDPSETDFDSGRVYYAYSNSADNLDFKAWKYIVGIDCKRYTDGLRAELFILDVELDSGFKEFEKNSIDKKGLGD